jgi:hypothetical protein
LCFSKCTVDGSKSIEPLPGEARREQKYGRALLLLLLLLLE